MVAPLCSSHDFRRGQALDAMAGMPALQRYLSSLPEPQRRDATDRLARLDFANALSMGVSEPQLSEHDYEIDGIGGAIPAQLRGTLYRNGPGRWEAQSGRPLHHLFDGDGMVSAFTIHDRGVRYKNRYVRTRHFRRGSGGRNMGTQSPGGLVFNIARLPPNLANTNVVEHAGHLYALWEGGPPHEIDPVTLNTLGVRRFDGELRWMGSYSAHPSFCPASGDMFNFGVEFIPRPHLRIYRTDRYGKLKHFRSAPMPYVAMVHDFSITQRYLVFFVSPIIPDAVPVALGLKPLGDALSYRPERGSAVILVPRDGGKIRHIDTDATLVFHLSNAFDDRDDVVIDAITYADGCLLERIARFHTQALDDAPSTFTRFRITSSGRVLKEALSDSACEFPRHHSGYEGMPHRYSYYNTRRHLRSFYDSITKLDLQDYAETTYTSDGVGNSFCEPVFTPRPGATVEDDGWLLTVEYQAQEHTSRLVILDAQDIAAGPIATAQLRQHLPQGFHGSYTPRDR